MIFEVRIGCPIMHLKISIIWFPVGLALMLAVTSSGCSKGDKVQATSREEAAKPIKTEMVRQEAIRRTVDVVGTLAAADQVTISSEAAGRVSRILADLGDPVNAGQVLVELDREKAEYNAEGQAASLERALAKYGAGSPDRLPPVEQTPDVQRAGAELFQARQAYDRAAELHKRQLLPKQVLDDADATLRSRQAGYDAALQNAKNLRADIAASVASAKLADRQLRDAYIRAPFNGHVEKRLVSLGQLVDAQTPVMSIVRVDPLKVTAEIPEAMAPWIKVGQAIELSVDAYPDKPFVAAVSRISPAVSPQTRAFPFEGQVPNNQSLLKPGTFARVHIESGKVDQVLTLPYAAIQYRYGVNRVFVVQGNRLAARELKVGERIGERIEILSGVKAGEPVAVTDVDQLADSQRVSVGPAGE
jgi:multidrug efflux pump subunit AcrA (membrane-fusion protein)